MASPPTRRRSGPKRRSRGRERPLIQPQWKKAVVGARVARTLGLGLGGTITPVHGKFGEFGYHEHPEATCDVVGILAPTNSPLDTTIFLPIGLHYLIDGHEGGVFLVETPPGKTPDDAKKLPVEAGRIGLTAIVVDPKDHFGARLLRQEFSSKEAQVAWPADVIPKFLQQVGNAADALAVIAWLVLLVAAISITVAIYNTMNERRREIAIMRSLGARRFQILAIIVGEAALLSLFGAVLGSSSATGRCSLLQGVGRGRDRRLSRMAAVPRLGAWLRARGHRPRRAGRPAARDQGLDDAGRRQPGAELLGTARGPASTVQ
jgi:putative ABC transport system permease protein